MHVGSGVTPYHELRLVFCGPLNHRRSCWKNSWESTFQVYQVSSAFKVFKLDHSADGRNPASHLICSLSHDLQGFRHHQWLFGISEPSTVSHQALVWRKLPLDHFTCFRCSWFLANSEPHHVKKRQQKSFKTFYGNVCWWTVPKLVLLAEFAEKNSTCSVCSNMYWDFPTIHTQCMVNLPIIYNKNQLNVGKRW